MKKCFLILGIAVLLILVNSSQIMAGDRQVKKIRPGVLLGWNWQTDSKLSDSGGSFIIGPDLGIIIKDRFELYFGLALQGSLDIFLLGIGDTFTAGHFLVGGYYHLTQPGPGLDFKAGGGLDFGTAKYEFKDDDSGTGFWLGLAMELPIRLGFIEPRLGIEGRYLNLRLGKDTKIDFGGFQLVGTFKIGF